MSLSQLFTDSGEEDKKQKREDQCKFQNVIKADFSSNTFILAGAALVLQVQWHDVKSGDIIIALIKISVPL